MTNDTKIIIGITLFSIALLVAAVVFPSRGSSVPTAPTQTTSVDQSVLIRPDSHEIATASAQLTLVEFGDYQCPACGQAEPIVEQILQEYQGKINFVFRNFPLSQHQFARQAAEAAEAAGAQGQFWAMHDLLYKNQDTWSKTNDPLPDFVQYAQQLNLNIDQFKADVTGNKFASVIQADVNDGNTVGIDATPTFFLNNQKITGVPTLDQFRLDINAALGPSGS